jgi:hypothetical protein
MISDDEYDKEIFNPELTRDEEITIVQNFSKRCRRISEADK